MQCLLDTNIVLRLILGDNKTQVAKIVNLVEKTPCIVDTISVFECVYILSGYYGFTRDDIKNSLISINSYQNITLPEQTLNSLERFAQNTTISFADSYLLEQAHSNKMKLITFDKKILAVSAGIAKEPA